MELNVDPQKKSLLQKVKYFFIRPSELFMDYKENPKWGINFILIGIITAAFTYLSKIVAKDAYTDMYNAQFAKMPPAQAEAARQSIELFNTPVMNAITVVIAVITIFVMLLLLSLIYFGLIKLFKGKAKFQQVFSVYLVSYWAMNISMVFKLVYTYLTHKMTYFNFTPSYVDVLLNNLDIFILWQSILLVFGFSAVAELDEKKSIAVVVLVWLGTVAVSIVPVLLKG